MKRRGLRRAVSFLLSFVLVLGMCMTAVPNNVKAADGDVVFTVTADKQVLHRGDTVTVTVSMAGNTDAYGVQCEYGYDKHKLNLENVGFGEVITATKAEPGTNLADASGADGSISIVIAKSSSPIINGNIVNLTFKVLEDASAGNVAFDTQDIIVSDETSNPTISYDSVDNTNLSIVIPATGISLNKTTADIAKGQTEQLTATLTPADSNSEITWKSSDESVASVDGNGLVTAKKAGKATITATAEGKSAACTVNVTIPLNKITIKGTVSTIKKGQTTQLSVEYDPEDTTENKTVTWSSSNESHAKVDQNGLVTAVADGDAVITAKVGNKTATYAISVKEVKLTSISIKSAATIHRGESEKLEVTYNPADTTDDRTVRWTSSDETKVKVDGNGNVTAVAVGGADITATVGDKTATCHVTVDAPLKSIIPAQTSVEMVKKQTYEIKYTLDPADTTDSKAVTFASSATDVVDVDATGKLTAKKAGDAVITLTGANGVKAEVNVTVTEIPVDRVILDKLNATVEKGDSIDLTATLGPDNTTDDDKTIKWTSSDNDIVSVNTTTSNSGDEVTVTAGQKGGTATITATAWNGTKATCEIFVPIHMTGISLPAGAMINRNSTTNPATKVLDVVYDPENTTDDKTVTWKSDNPEIAKVDPVTGVIEGLKEGTANITATTTGTKTPYSATTKITVVENHLDEALGDEIEFEKVEEPVLKGQSINMYSQMNLAAIIEENQITDDIVITWTSSDPTVATVDQSGAVWGVKEGKTTIKAVITAIDGSGNQVGEYTVETEIEIKEIPLESIAFNKIIKEMQVGATDTLSIIYNPDNTTDVRDVVWTSSDPTVLSVKDGKLTALKAGTAEITAKVGDKTATCTITVKAASSANGNKVNGGKNQTGTGVNTGDTANIGLYIMLMFVSAAVIAILCLGRSHVGRRRRVRR